jgi:two-component system cell cycle sensor histidine kinase/response regulator CckA
MYSTKKLKTCSPAELPAVPDMKPAKHKRKASSEKSYIRELEQALMESEAHRQGLLDSALDCIICTDIDSKITDFNLAAERTFRIARSNVLNKDLADVVLPGPLREQYRKELMATPPLALLVVGNRFETRCLRSDGTEFPAELTVSRTVINKKVSFVIRVRDITARKRAEEAVVWLAAIVESCKDAVYGGDLDGKITSWNKSAEIMYGYTAQEMIGQRVSRLIPEECGDELGQVMTKIQSEIGVHDFETFRRTKDGKVFDVSLSISPVFDSGGLIGVSTIARDITARKAAEEALRKATETSIYGSPISIIALDAFGRVTMWNSAAEQVFGWKEEEVLGHPNPITPGGDADDTPMLYEQLLSGKTITGQEVCRRRRDGSLVTLSLSGMPIWDKDKRVKGMVKFLTDITQQKRVEEDLRRAQEKYKSIFENSLEGIYQTTPDGKYISANPALARMMGFDSVEELLSSRQDLRTQEYVEQAKHTEFVSLMEEHGLVRNFQYQAFRKDGKTIWVSENAQVVRDTCGNIIYFEGTVEDITQRRELEEQIRQMQKIEAIGRLAGGVAHDFNNILMAISSFGELLARKLSDDASRRYLDEIVKATDRGSSLTQGLLAFSRKQVLSLKVVDLNQLISGQINMLKRLITESIELKFIPNPELAKVRVDPGQIEQVVMNLVINARDAMLYGGELVIETYNAVVGKADRSGEQLAAGNYMVLAVSDNGCGMDAETKSHLFEPFFTTKQQGKGTGLGLATVFGIIKQSSGYIFVHSKPGHGTTFKIYLPRVEDVAEPVKQEITGAPVTGHETILLVEDEEAVRTSAAEYLKENGYKVLVASRASEAMEIAEQHKSVIDLLLTDLVMPKVSGRHLAENIKQIHPETKIVFMSGYSNNLLSSEDGLDQKHILLQKPFRLSMLGQCIRNVLSSKTLAASSGN